MGKTSEMCCLLECKWKFRNYLYNLILRKTIEYFTFMHHIIIKIRISLWELENWYQSPKWRITPWFSERFFSSFFPDMHYIFIFSSKSCKLRHNELWNSIILRIFKRKKNKTFLKIATHVIVIPSILDSFPWDLFTHDLYYEDENTTSSIEYFMNYHQQSDIKYLLLKEYLSQLIYGQYLPLVLFLCLQITYIGKMNNYM